jgi:alpha-1,2-mannosyltransferase
VAGVLVGLLAYKPQVWLLVPLALLAARAWRRLSALVATVSMLFLVTLCLFGTELWLAFVSAALHASTDQAAAEIYARVHTHMTTLLAAGKILGLADGPAMALQFAGGALAVASVVWSFACHPASHARTAVLVTATFLVSPYTLNYDLLLLMPAAALLFLQPPSAGYRPGEGLVYLAVLANSPFLHDPEPRRHPVDSGGHSVVRRLCYRPPAGRAQSRIARDG